jgi:hypothetical protein
VCQRTNRRRSDVGNLYPTAKAVVDGLVDYGLIEDDDDTRLIGPDMRRGQVVAKRAHPLGLLVIRVIPLPERIEIGSATW